MKPLILALFLLSPILCRANSYDDDEQIRRDAQKLVDEDKRQRDAAKQRADAAEGRNQDDGGGGGVIILVLIGVGVGIWMKYKK